MPLPGDTIIVESGIYKGPIIMGRPVNLQGLDTGSGSPHPRSGERKGYPGSSGCSAVGL